MPEKEGGQPHRKNSKPTRAVPISPDDKVHRAIIHFPLVAERPVPAQGAVSAEDQAWTDKLAAELKDAMTRPLTETELAAAEAQVARSDRAYALLDQLIAAAQRGALDLEEHEGDDVSTFYVLVSDSPKGDWGEKVAVLVLGDGADQDRDVERGTDD